MAIRAVVFDIGGVLEITPDLGVDRRWEARLGLPAGEMGRRMGDVWMDGGLGMITLDDVHQATDSRTSSTRSSIPTRPGWASPIRGSMPWSVPA